jgi:cytoskeletal protein CcmA (bactofilin family)
MHDLNNGHRPVSAENEGTIELDIVALGVTMILPREFKGHGAFALPAGGLLIHGQWDGEIKVNGVVIISRTAVVRGRIHAQTVYVDGNVVRRADESRSEIRAVELVITDTGRCAADVVCKVWSCGKGSRFDGTVQSGS